MYFFKGFEPSQIYRSSCNSRSFLGFKAFPFSSDVFVIVFEHQIGIVIAYCISLWVGDTYVAYDTVFWKFIIKNWYDRLFFYNKF